MLEAVIFDCFGVFYTDPVFAYMRRPTTSLNTANALHALDKLAAEGKLDKSGFIHRAEKLLKIPQESVEDQFFRPHRYNQQLIDFVTNIRSKYKTALLSNIGGDMMDSFFGPDDYKTLFDVVVLTGNVRITKPDPRIFELTCRRLGVEPENTLMVDDMVETIKAVKGLGMHGICYKDFPQFIEEWNAFESHQP
jgi:epoxide hydrolase-like predicted phosphatase